MMVSVKQREDGVRGGEGVFGKSSQDLHGLK